MTQGVVEKQEERRPQRNWDNRQDSRGIAKDQVSRLRTRRGFRTTPDVRLTQAQLQHQYRPPGPRHDQEQAW